MNCRSKSVREILLVAAVALSFVDLPVVAQSPAAPANPASAWQSPQPNHVKTEALAWLDAQKVAPAVRAKAEAIWSGLLQESTEDDLLMRLARTFALTDPRADRLLEMCSQPRSELMPPSEKWLRNAKLPPLFANNLRLLFGRWLVEASLFDEALEQLSDLAPGDVVAPALLLFNQSVVYHALLRKESGLKTIGSLLQGSQSSPRRYVALAMMMQDDLTGLEEETLDHVTRRMEDIRRRLDLGRAGPKVQKVEKGVIQTLDKLIKKLEDEESQCGGGGNLHPSSPMQRSQIAGGKGPGTVEKKNIGAASGWGDLPPKEREEAMQQIGRDFPSHYRDAIEQYFRRLAAEKNEPEKP
jgi:hypothetical protein